MKLQLLIVDSGKTGAKNLDVLYSLLEGTDYSVGKYTSDLNDAVGLVLSRQFDILLCINRAPEFIAAKLLRLTGGSQYRIPAIVISEQDDSQRMRECFLLGAIDFLSEPIPPEDFLGALTRATSQVHEKLIDSEYELAVEEALATLSQSEELKSVREKLRAFLYKMKHQTATVDLAADYFGFNRDYFGRYFKNKFGLTFGDFYKKFQINYAQRLLLTRQLKVLEVSKLLGFSTPDYFTRVFKQYTGSTPSAVKK